MFDIGFAELLMVAVVALIVLGPQRLPETIRFVGLWIGRLRRGLSAARRELEQEIGMDDIRRQLHNEEVLRELEKSRQHLADLDRREAASAKPGQADPAVAGTSGSAAGAAPGTQTPEGERPVPRQDQGQ